MHKDIAHIARDLNSRCPIQIDQTIRLDSCEEILPKTIKYNYTYLFIDGTKIDQNEFKEQIEDYILYNTQTNKDFSALRKIGATFIFSCKDEKHNHLGEITVDQESYSKPINKPSLINSKLNTEDSLFGILQDIVEQTQKQLPLFTEESGVNMIDCRTYDKTLEYTCKLLNEDVNQFDTIYFKTNGVPAAVQSLKDNPQMRVFAQHGVYISNIYVDRDNNYLCTITISPEEYM
ncbi:MAG: hypothetical protein RL662_2507 [Bacteroidota bacterium]|jgi:hypothetical protein